MPSTLAQSDQPVAGVDPALVPFRTLSSGARMPSPGLGTFGSDHVSHDAVAEAVKYAASIGYRHFDCASVYGNEEQIGNASRILLLLRAPHRWSGSSHQTPEPLNNWSRI
jgi:hypothetical protein